MGVSLYTLPNLYDVPFGFVSGIVLFYLWSPNGGWYFTSGDPCCSKIIAVFFEIIDRNLPSNRYM